MPTKPKTKTKPATTTRTFEQLLAPYPDTVQALARTTRTWIRALLREAIPELIETVDATGPYIGYGLTAGYKGAVCTIIVSKAEIKLGIIGAASLPDPHDLLAGTGKVHRFVRVTSAADLRRPGVEQLVNLAARGAIDRLALPARRRDRRA